MTERGTVLAGRYELDQVIGRGGMAEVWRARDRRLVRDVAVKRLRIDLASDPTFQARFRREAQSSAGLNHPNIVAVYDTGEERDANSDVSVPYIVMELVEGVTLRDVLRDGRKIVPERALEFTRGVLEALAYSHRAGIIHRDIKPANVMLTPSGSVKVMDFGIARAVADTSATMTQTAAVIGTAQYLSPEQARGEKVDNRSDIYSVGCLLYELLVSQPPFTGDSPVSVAYQHVRETPLAPSDRDPEITPDMDAIVLKALAKDPADRYQDAREFADDVTRAIDGEPVHAVAPPRPEDDATALMEDPTQPYRPQRLTTPVPGEDDELDPDDGEAMEVEKPRSRKGLTSLGILAGLLIVALAVALWMLMNPPTPEVETVMVPNVIGWNEEAATERLEQEQLNPVVEYVEGTDSDVGNVVEQDPGADTEVEIHSDVKLQISEGPTTLEIPEEIIGMQQQEAEDLLDEAGFKNVTSAPPVNANDEPTDTDPGEVFEVKPAVGAEVAPDSLIRLTVATGRSIVPDLLDMTADEAGDVADKAGFKIDVEEQESDKHTEGLIFDQRPEPTQLLERTVRIKVIVAIEPEPTPTPTRETEDPDPTDDPPSPTETDTEDDGDEDSDESDGDG